MSSTPCNARAGHLLALLAVLLVVGCEHDFGDAPDGGPTGYPQGTLVGGGQLAQTGDFPSLEASDGARVLSVDDVTFGPGGTLEGDALVTNLDLDDGNFFMVAIIVSIPPPAQMIVQVTGHTPGTYFLNGLIDLNMDGDWDDVGPNGEQEWVIQNFPVNVGAGRPTAVVPPPFAFGWGNRLPVVSWMRVALTDTMVTGAWDGTGEFATGEIEDHPLLLPVSGDDDDDDDDDPCDAKPIVDMDCDGPYVFPDGVDELQVRCTLTNGGGDGRVSWTLAPINGCDVAVGPPVDPIVGARPIGCPNGRIVLNFTARRGASLPCSWSYDARVEDPPSYMTAEGLVVGYTNSTGSFLLTAEGAEVVESWIESLSAIEVESGAIVARAELNEQSLEHSEGAFIEFELMYPDGELVQRRAEVEGGLAQTEFSIRGKGVHTVRVARLVGSHLDHRRDRDVTMIGVVVVE